MTNKHTHHLNQRVFNRQADTSTVQQLPTDGLVLTDKRTTGGGDAGLPHPHPLDAERIVISRVHVRKPADQTPRRPEAGPMHQRLAEKGRERLLHKGEGVSLPDPGSQSITSSGTHSTRPDTGRYTNTARGLNDREVPEDPDSTHSRTPRGGGKAR